MQLLLRIITRTASRRLGKAFSLLEQPWQKMTKNWGKESLGRTGTDPIKIIFSVHLRYDHFMYLLWLVALGMACLFLFELAPNHCQAQVIIVAKLQSYFYLETLNQLLNYKVFHEDSAYLFFANLPSRTFFHILIVLNDLFLIYWYGVRMVPWIFFPQFLLIDTENL